MITDFIQATWFLNRTPINRDMDRVIQLLEQELECEAKEFPSGADCLTWTLPKNWEVRAGYLETLNGRKIADFNVNPLHLWSNSISVAGEFSRTELENHLLYDEIQPDAIPTHYQNIYRHDALDWGFSLSYRTYQTLSDPRYQVFIDADLDDANSMKVIDYVLPGERDDTIFFAAHTCHPAVVADGISNVAVTLALFKELSTRSHRRYTYRLILGPEYYAAAAILASASDEELLTLKSGVFLDGLGNRQPITYQSSFRTDATIDRVTANVFSIYDPEHTRYGYRKLWGNDEMFYDGPGFRIPMVGIGGSHYAAHHMSADDIDLVDFEQLTDSVDLLLRIIDVFENDYTPELSYKGPLYLSRHQLYVDPRENPQLYGAMLDMQIMADGYKSCLDIATELELNFFDVKEFFDTLIGIDLARAEPIHHFK